MFYYAQLDAKNRAHTISQLTDKVDNEHLIEISEYDITLLGKVYNPITKEFEQPAMPEPPQNP